ncbi:MAG TPA: hypothetical protein VKB26_06140 [Candidatus Acidoferrales bacterium]|nr:hypothetical protein [Candidatus Acidoferrales bacterium]
MSSVGGPHWLVAAWRAGATMFRVFWKLLRQLFHEAAGALFGIFAIYGGTASWKQSHQPGGQWIAVFAAAYAAIMAFFCISSFRNARRVR